MRKKKSLNGKRKLEVLEVSNSLNCRHASNKIIYVLEVLELPVKLLILDINSSVVLSKCDRIRLTIESKTVGDSTFHNTKILIDADGSCHNI